MHTVVNSPWSASLSRTPPQAEQFKGCKFSGGRPTSQYIVFQPNTGIETDDTKSTGDDGEVSGCEFQRASGFKGLAIAVKRLNFDDSPPNMGKSRKFRPRNTLIEYNVCGGSDPSLDGYFVTCINDGGEKTIVRYNTIRRFVDVRATSSNAELVKAAKEDQDHGIYSKGAINSTYSGNVVAGWMPYAAGGAFKLDGSQGIQLFDNRMATSGILMYSNMNKKNPVPLRDIYIRSNKIYFDPTNISPWHTFNLSDISAGTRGQKTGDIYRGIGIWIENAFDYGKLNGGTLEDSDFASLNCDDTIGKCLSDYSTPGAGTSIRIESTEVWGPYGLIHFKAAADIDIAVMAEPSYLYSGSGGVFDSLACEIDQALETASNNSYSLYNGDFATDCAHPDPISGAVWEEPALAALTVGRFPVLVLKPNATRGWCGDLGSSLLCDKAYRWAKPRNKPNIELQICDWDPIIDRNGSLGYCTIGPRPACPGPPAQPPSPPPPSPPPPSPPGHKRGIIMSGQITETCLEHFGMVTWAYNYQHYLETQTQVDWLNKYNIEFVPSVHAFFVDSQDGIGVNRKRCYLTESTQEAVSVSAGNQQWSDSPLCSNHAELSLQLSNTISLLNVRPLFLFLANEPSVVHF